MRKNKYLKFFEDSVQGSILDRVRDFVLNTPIISGNVDKVSEDLIHDISGKYLWVEFEGGFKDYHIQKHFDKNGLGSLWTISEDKVRDLIIETMEQEPTFANLEGPAGREIFKYKWTNIDCGQLVGLDSLRELKKLDKSEEVEDLEPFGLANREGITWETLSSVATDSKYELVKKEGDVTLPYTEDDLKNGLDCYIKQMVGIFYGDKEPTSLVNVIMSKIGEIDGKPVLTMMTIFPGISPVDDLKKDIINKKDLKKHGYALIKPKVNESFSRIMSFRKFNNI